MSASSKDIVIVDYGVGNLTSLLNLCKRLSVQAEISGRPEDILEARRLILPGVGSFAHGMENLRGRGLVEALNKKVLTDRAPLLGICLGMQLLAESSEEGNARGLGWIEAEVVKFRLEDHPGLRVPHVGFNDLQRVTHPLFKHVASDARFYFTHSYHMQCRSSERVLGTTDYGYNFPSVISRDNIFGTQFHPEKSHQAGLQLIRGFLEVT